MTFLCEQPNIDAMNGLQTIVSYYTEGLGEEATARLAIKAVHCHPIDEDEKDLWMEVKNKDEAEAIAIKSILDECERTARNYIAASSKIAFETRRGAGNIILTNSSDKTDYQPVYLGIKVIYDERVPKGTGIILYKGKGEIDGGFYFSFDDKKSYLYFTPKWRNYAKLFNT